MTQPVQLGPCTLYNGDCREVLQTLSGVHSVITDPPYGLKFMGKQWDYDVPSDEIWRACFASMLPGAHLLAFAGTRTQHRMAVRIEDAGFEIRDMIAWLYGSGFPKSLDVSKAIDKSAGVEREVVGKVAGMGKQNPEWNGTAQGRSENSFKPEYNATAPATDAARQWSGWGTALKPAMEPITVARKPLAGTVAENVQTHGVGAINIDGCRVAWIEGKAPKIGTPGWGGPSKTLSVVTGQEGKTVVREEPNPNGRWPANVIHDGSEDVTSLFPQTSSGKMLPHHQCHESQNRSMSGKNYARDATETYGDTGSAARFFYCAKASREERDSGLDGLPVVHKTCRPKSDDEDNRTIQERLHGRMAKNHHPTVKPVALMQYLCKLVTPPNGIILDPFLGSGSTGIAAVKCGFKFIGIELDKDYFQIACDRIARELQQPFLLTP